MYRKFEAPADNIIFYSKLNSQHGEKGKLGKWGKIGFGDLKRYDTYEGPRTMIHAPVIHWKLGHFAASSDGTLEMYKLSEIPTLIKNVVTYNKRRIQYERSASRRR